MRGELHCELFADCSEIIEKGETGRSCQVRQSLAALRAELDRARSQLCDAHAGDSDVQEEEVDEEAEEQPEVEEELEEDQEERQLQSDPEEREDDEQQSRSVDAWPHVAAAASVLGPGLGKSMRRSPLRSCGPTSGGLPPCLPGAGACASGSRGRFGRSSSCGGAGGGGHDGKHARSGARRISLHEPRSRRPVGARKDLPKGLNNSEEEEALSQAKALTKVALEEFGQNQREIAHLVDSRQSVAQDPCAAQGEARARMQSCVAACSRSAAGVRGLEVTISEVEDGISKLQHMRYARWTDTVVCERRLELLDQRPLQDSSGDTLMEALECEWQMLHKARQDLLDKEAEMRQILEELEEARRSLLAETATRRSNCRADQAMLRAASALSHSSSAPSLASRREQKANQLGQQLSWAPAEHRDLPVRLVVHIQKDAARVRRDCDPVLHTVAHECAAAGDHVRRCLDTLAAEKLGLRRSLDEQIKNVDYAITAAEMSLARMSRWLDPDSSRGTAKYERSESTLQELRASKRKLQLLHQRTLHSQGAVDACKRVTATAAAAAAAAVPATGRRRAPSASASVAAASAEEEREEDLEAPRRPRRPASAGGPAPGARRGRPPSPSVLSANALAAGGRGGIPGP